MFHRIQQGRFHIHIVPVNAAADASLEHSRDNNYSASVVATSPNSANLSSVLVLFNAMMVMTAMDPSAAESDFLCRHTESYVPKQNN